MNIYYKKLWIAIGHKRESVESATIAHFKIRSILGHLSLEKKSRGNDFYFIFWIGFFVLFFISLQGMHVQRQ